MPQDSQLIDRIVHGVLSQLGQSAAVAASPQLASAASSVPDKSTGKPSLPATPALNNADLTLSERIITGDLLLAQVQSGQKVIIGTKALLTPSAWDVIRAKRLVVQRAVPVAPASNANSSRQGVFVVRKTPAVEKLVHELPSGWTASLANTTEESGRSAISAICRGEFPCIVIFTAEPHLAALVANRNEKIRAVAVADASTLKAVRQQLTPNVICVDPTGKSYFELKTLFQAVVNCQLSIVN